jgi:hypothetical protein
MYLKAQLLQILPNEGKNGGFPAQVSTSGTSFRISPQWPRSGVISKVRECMELARTTTFSQRLCRLVKRH